MEYNNLFEEFKSLTEEYLTEDKVTEMKVFFDTVSANHTNIQTFTDLQKTVFENPDFWSLEYNSIIQGTTSSGKTLIAETAIAYQLSLYKKVIYLVPLKALTTEKTEIFMNDFPQKRVYSSSSDYQEHDIDFSRGSYDIGVLVYEKFFALLSQKNSRILKDCGLIVVDEMHMISDSERGPKLEFALEKVRFSFGKEHNANRPLICGLTTVESNVSEVFRWLGGEKETIIINSNSRPVIIEERFVYGSELDEENSFLTERYINGRKIEEKPDFKINPDIKPANDRRIYQLLQILDNHKEDKIIIFCNSKTACEETARLICESGCIEPTELKFSDFPNAEECEMEEEHYSRFISRLKNYGVTYHNSSHTSIVRNYIEKNFEKDIRIVVATETLTMGVNMPTDIMVLYDIEVNREDSPRFMTYHEYKNAIGRAGRYGKSRNNQGISYVLCRTPNDMKKAVKAYIENPEILRITSGLRTDSISMDNYAIAIAPYYLSILSSGKDFSESDVYNIVTNALCRPEKINIENEKKLTENIIRILESSYTDDKIKKGVFPSFISEPDDPDDFMDTADYTVKMSGLLMASFALSMNTYTRIWNRFIKKTKTGNKKREQHYIPEYTEENPFDIEPHEEGRKYDRPSYFLDVIFEVCSMPEIREKKRNQYVTIRGGENEYRKAVLRFLKGKESLCWEDSVLRKYCREDCAIDDINNESLQPIFRTIVLYYWVLGTTAPKIRKKLQLPFESRYYIYSSEIESLGELCAFQLEAISKAFDSIGNNKMRNMFYSLSIRVKYGMGSHLAQIASKHIQGVSRTKLLRMEKTGKENGFSNVVEFLNSRNPILNNIIGREHQQKLIESLRKTNIYDYNNMLEYLNNEDVINDEIISLLGRLRTFGQKTADIMHTLLFHMGLNAKDIEKDSESLTIKPYCLKLYFCMKDESLNINDDFITIGIYNNKDTERNNGYFIHINNICEIILYSIHYVRSVAESGMYFIRLLRDYPEYGDMILRSAKREELFNKYAENKNVAPEEFSPVSVKKTETPFVNITNNYNYMDNRTVLKDNNIQVVQKQNINHNYINIVNNYLNDITVQLNDIKIQPDKLLYNDEKREIQEDEYFNKSYIELNKQPAPYAPTPEDIKAILEKNGNNPSFDELCSYIGDTENLETMVYEALYIEDIIVKHKLNDYSSASVMYSRALEHCLKMRVFPFLAVKGPEFKCRTDSGNMPLKKIDSKKVMLGSIMYIIKNLLLSDQRYNKITEWKTLYDLIEKAKDIRNPCSHSGEDISSELICNLRNAVFDVIEYTSDKSLYQ